MANRSPAIDSFHVTAAPTVHITVYDADWTELDHGDQELRLELSHGFYRIHFERGGIITKQLVEHSGATVIAHPHDDPPLRSPVPLTGAATTQPRHDTAAMALSAR